MPLLTFYSAIRKFLYNLYNQFLVLVRCNRIAFILHFLLNFLTLDVSLKYICTNKSLGIILINDVFLDA